MAKGRGPPASPGKQKAREQSSRVLCIPFRISILGDNGAIGAGVAAGTAVQAGSGVDDIGIIALADSAGGASVRASAAAHAGRSDLIGHG